MNSPKDKARPDSLETATDLSALDGLDDDGLDGLDALGSLESLEGDDEPNPDDPIGDLDYDSLTNEEVAVKETSAVLEAFKARAKAEQARFALATDSEYWVGLCFQTREQKEAFLTAAKLIKAGDKYIDGQLLAQRMGIELPPAAVPYNVSAKVDAKYAALVKDL
ncbi:MAG: hypothetical protein KKG67_20360 [Gammaproteobacteria bacterium]|nr:hypothetical protein [Gammaproteobacteria bacterium]